ncbi:MAG: hypothetical protein U1A28_01430 [Patescibacteria group bacterium]|nr:hypothetical protein [Patescibacteria group bacterium]
MSLSASGASLGLGAGVPTAVVPRLVAGRYAEWRPEMENVLMRAGVARRDYTEENPDWLTLVEAVEQWTRANENASVAYALGRGVASSSSKAGPSAGEMEARRGASEVVARTNRAYTLLYQSLSDELRRLVAQVPQGYAFGIWNWLEKRFQSTEQDHVGDLWDEFTQLAQEEDESFDVFKSRVDRVHGLLAHAKDKPSPGLYAHRLLWKLSPRYSPAVLALKASGKLKDAGARKGAARRRRSATMRSPFLASSASTAVRKATSLAPAESRARRDARIGWTTGIPRTTREPRTSLRQPPSSHSSPVTRMAGATQRAAMKQRRRRSACTAARRRRIPAVASKSLATSRLHGEGDRFIADSSRR